MAALLVGGVALGVDKLRTRRKAKKDRAARLDLSDEPSSSRDPYPASPNPLSPAYSESAAAAAYPPRSASGTDFAGIASAAKDGRTHHTRRPADDALATTAHDEVPPPYDTPPYEDHPALRHAPTSYDAHAADMLLESHPAPLRRTNSTPQGRRVCRIDQWGRCECGLMDGRRPRSPERPGETVEQRRARKQKEFWSWKSPDFWSFVGIGIASRGLAATPARQTVRQYPYND